MWESQRRSLQAIISIRELNQIKFHGLTLVKPLNAFFVYAVRKINKSYDFLRNNTTFQ